MDFYAMRGCSEAAKLANDALQLQLRARSVYRRDIFIGSVGSGLIGLAIGFFAWRSVESSAQLNQWQYAAGGYTIGLNLGAIPGVVVGAAQGAGLTRKAEGKVSEAASAWFRWKSPRIDSRFDSGRLSTELAWSF